MSTSARTRTSSSPATPRSRAETWAETTEKTRAEDEEKAYQDKLQSARKLKARGYPLADIADSLSLPEDVVAAL
jgi:hypothetical protein